jgi:RES domain-containing protein
MNQDDELLDSGFVEEIPKSRAHYEQLRQFHWEYYSELEYQRSKIYDSLKSSLRERAKAFEFSKWQRAVKYRYALHPLGTDGSLRDPGGRFNIGEIDPIHYPIFPALYIASDKGTALAELLGRVTGGSGPLTPEELALTRPDSIAVASVSGHLDTVLDVGDNDNLAPFVALIKSFRPSPALRSMATKLGFRVNLIRTVQELGRALHHSEWRSWPSLYDVPTTSQIFGRIALDAQVEGILYKSVLTQKTCLAIYHQNFQNSSSYVELDDSVPLDLIVRRLDSSNCTTMS